MNVKTLTASIIISCVLSATAVAQNLGSPVARINQEKANYWERTVEALNEQGEAFRPFLYESLPIWGQLPSGLPQTKTLRLRGDEQQQLMLLLRHQCEPDMFQKMVEWANSDDSTLKEFELCRVTFVKSIESLSPKNVALQIERNLRPLWQTHDVVGLKLAISKIAATLDLKTKPLQNNASIRLWIASRIHLRTYDMKTDRFPLQFPTETLPAHVDGYDRIKLNWPANYPLPADWKVDRQTASRIKQHTSRSGVLAMVQVELTQFQAVNNGSTLLSNELSARARVVETRLLSYDKNAHLLATFPAIEASAAQPEPKHASASADTLTDDALARKMQKLAAEHNLSVFRGGILVPDRDFQDSPAAMAYQKRLAQLLDRVVVTLNPASFNALFASHRFPDTIGRDVIVQGLGRWPSDAQWAGGDQFARDAAKEKVWNRYVAEKEKIDVHLPLRFVATCRAYTERYDKESEAFSINCLRDGASEWFNDGLLSAGALPTPAMFRINRVFNSRLIETPVLFSRTLPIAASKAPEFARRHRIDAEGTKDPFFLATSFTINEIPQQPHQEPTDLPVMAVQGEWLSAFEDQGLTSPLYNYELLQPPPPYVVSPHEAAYRQPEHFSRLSGDFLWAVALNKGQQKPSPESLTQRILYRRSLWNEYELLQIAVKNASYAVDRAGNRRNPDSDDVRLASQQMENATDQFRAYIRTMPSPFWPAPGTPTEEHAANLHSDYQNWLRATLEHPCRYRVTCEVHPDPYSDDVALNFRLGAGVGRDRINSLPGDLASVLKESVNVEGLYLLPNVMQGPFEIDDQRIEPCLQLSVDAQTMLKRIPPDAFKLDESQRHQTLVLDIDLEFTDTTWFTDPTDRNQHALVISASAVHGILRLGDSEIRYQGPLQGVLQPSEISTSAPRLAKPVTSDNTPKTLTPADVAPLLCGLQGNAFASDVLQHMRHLYDYEARFRQRPDDDGASGFGIDPRDGLFFMRSDPRPEFPLSQTLQQRFLTWATQRNRPVGSIWVSCVERKFGERNDDGYLLRLHRFDGGHLENLNREINSLQRRVADELQFNQNSEATYGTVNSQSDLSTPLKARLAELSLIRDNSQISMGWFELSDTEPARRPFVVPDLEGSLRAGARGRSSGRKWDPDAPPQTEPIIPIVRFDSEVFLPEAAGITPQQETFLIQLSYSIQTAEMAKTPPWPTEEHLGTYGAREGGQYFTGDDGRYVILNAKIQSAFILHPKTHQPLIELTVKAARQPKLVK